MENISWYDAVEFCNKLSKKDGLIPAYSGSGKSIKINRNTNGYRLPTEAQLEFTARGGNKSKGYKYSGSNSGGDVAWYWKNSGDKALNGDWDWNTIESNNCKTHNVGTKKANELGIYDMSGSGAMIGMVTIPVVVRQTPWVVLWVLSVYCVAVAGTTVPVFYG